MFHDLALLPAEVQLGHGFEFGNNSDLPVVPLEPVASDRVFLQNVGNERRYEFSGTSTGRPRPVWTSLC